MTTFGTWSRSKLTFIPLLPPGQNERGQQCFLNLFSGRWGRDLVPSAFSEIYRY